MVKFLSRYTPLPPAAGKHGLAKVTAELMLLKVSWSLSAVV